ncbi:unnamed protein product [Rhizoctonia solani]|uniref:Helicase C-terminal domain-containing protein n=1 Tax=Rhizoctonia solani TaxID=456999 RepID=A0A8H3DWM4_9AGAM|nr:unnamed protein product [Rhizoctonia solani]
MPLQPLAKIPLTFLADVDVGLGPSPYDVLPWTNGPFRRLCGLKPAKGEEIDGGDDGDDESVEIAQGFILTDQAMHSLKETDRKFFTPEACQKITDFCIEVRKHGEQLRRPVQADAKKKRKRKEKKTSNVADDDYSDQETFVDRVENIPGYAEFKGASLAMQNRAGGAIEETIKIMKEMDRTPLTAWKNYVYTSQVLPSRPMRMLPDNEIRRQRQEDVDAKKSKLNYKPPSIGRYLDDRLVARVASSVFGAAAFMESSDILWGCYRRATKIMIGRAWERDAREAKKTLKRTDKTKKEYQEALKAARDKPCPRRLHMASNCLKAWKNLAEITGEATEPSFPASVAELEDLWSELGYSSGPTELGDEHNVRRGKKLRYALATPEQMQAAYTVYREQHFCDMDGAMSEMTEALGHLQQENSVSSSDTADLIPVDLLSSTGHGDLGVNEFAQTPITELLRLLGIDKTGVLPLTSESLKIMWHQLVSIAIILKRMFTPNLDDMPDPTLLCDDVGLGKTAQLLGVISTANAIRHRTFFVHQEAIEMAKEELLPIIIRRTGKSKDPSGTEILDLAPYYETIAWSAQREHEMEAVRNLKEALMNHENDGDTKEMQFIWKNFLLDHKKTLFHWLLAKWKPEDPPFWLNWTAESLSEDASSKILTAIALTEHYQKPDAKPLFFKTDGTRDLVKEQECECKPANKARKVIIFVMYIIHRKIMKMALSLVGLESVDYDGRMSPEMRDDALKQFEADENIRVLLMSNVGTTGLNLTMASVVIFLSGLWSGMEIKQTIGRVWRAGQSLTVIIHHILAPGTADVVLAGLAGDKVLMLDHLYEVKQIADKIFNVHVDKDDSDNEWQGEDKQPGSGRITKSKVRARQQKAVLAVDPQSAVTNNLVAQTESPPGVVKPVNAQFHVNSDKAPPRPRKRPPPVTSEIQTKRKDNQSPENAPVPQSLFTEDGARPSKKSRTLERVVVKPLSLREQSSPPASHRTLAPPSNGRSLSPLASASKEQIMPHSPTCSPSSPVCLPSSPSSSPYSPPRMKTPPLVLPSSQELLPRMESRVRETEYSENDRTPTVVPNSVPIATNQRRQVESSAGPSSRPQTCDPQTSQALKQYPGQFKRSVTVKRPAAVVGSRVTSVRRMFAATDVRWRREYKLVKLHDVTFLVS